MTRHPTADVLKALPPDLAEGVDAGASADAALAALLADLSHRPVPPGRLSRAWSVGSLQGRLGLAWLAYVLRSALAGADEQQRLKNRFHADAALRLLATMGHLRGAMTKVGQAMANYPDLLPDDFSDMLGKLHFEAPPMHFSLLREMVRHDLGGEPEALFAEFDTRPCAAASLGQVHRARLHSGESVAVKIQYPNIRRTIESDCRNLSMLMAPMTLRKQYNDLRDKLVDVRDTLLAETDYEREAAMTTRVRQILCGEGGDPQFVVPRVHTDYSTGRILTTDFIEGLHLPDFLAAEPSQERRDRHGTQIFQASLRLYYGARLNLSDPHPGNFLFLPDGRLGLIDFGCMREYDAAEWAFLDSANACFEAGAPDDLVDRMTVDGCLLEGKDATDPQKLELGRRMTHWLWEPLNHEGPFDFGDREFYRRGIDLLAECMRTGFTRSMPLYTWINRLFFGVRALLYRMGSRVDVHTIVHQEIARSRG